MAHGGNFRWLDVAQEEVLLETLVGRYIVVPRIDLENNQIWNYLLCIIRNTVNSFVISKLKGRNAKHKRQDKNKIQNKNRVR